MDLLNPLLYSPEEHPMSSDMKHVVTIDMEHHAETFKNEVEKGELSPVYREQTWRHI